MNCALWTLKATVCENVRHVTGFEIKQLPKFTEMLLDASLNTHACLNSHAVMQDYSYCWLNYEKCRFNLSGMTPWSLKKTLKVVWKTVMCELVHHVIDKNHKKNSKMWQTNSFPSFVTHLPISLPANLLNPMLPSNS